MAMKQVQLYGVGDAQGSDTTLHFHLGLGVSSAYIIATMQVLGNKKKIRALYIFLVGCEVYSKFRDRELSTDR